MHSTYSGDFIKLMEEIAEYEYWAENKIVTVPIGFKSAVTGEYTIKAFDFANVDKSISFSLKDNETNILQDLRKNPVYIFSSPKTNYNNEANTCTYNNVFSC